MEAAAAALFGAAGGVTTPGLWSVDGLAAQLLRAPVTWERPAPAFDPVGELIDVDDANLPFELIEALRELLSGVTKVPLRLSVLLNAARSPGLPDRLLETVWAACLWVWVADNAADEDAQPSDAGLAQLLARLAAVDDGTRIAGPDYVSPDLLVGAHRTTVAAAAIRPEQEASR